MRQAHETTRQECSFGLIAPPLAERFHVDAPDRRGHGRTPDVAGPITFDAMARDTIAFIESVTAAPVDLVGCSDGATVALLVACLRPDLVKRLVFVCGVFHHEGWLPGAIELDEEADAFLADWYGEVSPDCHEHWPVVKAKLYVAHLTEPRSRRVISPASRADARDARRPRRDAGRALGGTVPRAPNAQLAVIPGASHGLLVERPELCNAIIAHFLANRPTFAAGAGSSFDPPNHPGGRLMPRPRTTGPRLAIGIGAAAATLVATAGLAFARHPQPARRRSGPGAGPNVVTTVCGPNQTSIVKTDDSPTATSSVDRRLAGRRHANQRARRPDALREGAPDRRNRVPEPEPGRLLLRPATIDGAPMNPIGGGFEALDSEDGTASAHAYEWIKRVGEGLHTVRIERSVGNATTRFWTDDWTFDTSLHL